MIDPTETRDVLLNHLADEFAARHRGGERPRLEEYCDRHPDLADDIRSIFPALVELERAKADAGAELAQEFANAPPITELGDFRLLRQVGRGGMGVVYEAEQVSLGRRVAIKLLPANLFQDPAKRRRFEREARAAARFHHSNIVPVYGFGEHDGTPYYVMQFIPGLGLDAVIDELARVPNGARPPEPDRPRVGTGSALSVALAHSLLGENGTGAAGQDGRADHDRTVTSAGAATPDPVPSSLSDGSAVLSLSTSGVHLPGQSGSGSGGSNGKRTTYWESVARIGVQVAGALAYAHKLGVLHRDIKPANLLLDLDGIVWVADFGLAKAADSDDLTNTGDVLGTFRYMPPEAFEGKSDTRSDVYALGLTLFELVALRPAYRERDRNKLIKQVTTGDPPRLRKLRREAPRDLVTIVEKAIEKDPARRYQSAGSLAEDLQRFLDGRPITARRATEVERMWMWARRRPTTASLLGAVLLLLVAITVGSLVTAAHFHDLEQEQRGLVSAKANLADRNQRLAEENDAAKQKAEDAQTRAELALVDMQTARGVMAADQNDPARALLWFSKAAKGGAADPTRQAGNLLRARNWARGVTVPVRAFPVPALVETISFRPTGDLLLLLAGDRLFVRDWREEKNLPWCDGTPKVGAACWSPDGDILAVGFHSGTVQLLNGSDGTLLHEVKHSGKITSLAFSRNGEKLAVAGTTVRVLTESSGTFLPGEWQHPQPVHSMVFNPNGDRLITVGRDHKARIFAVGDADRPSPLVAPVQHQPNSAGPPALIDEGRRFITVYSAGDKAAELSFWDTATGTSAAPGVIRARHTHAAGVVAAPRGDWFATAGIYGPEVWKTSDNGTKSVYRSEHTGHVDWLTPSPDGKFLLTASWDSTARLWSMPDGAPIGSPLPHMGIVYRCAFANDNLHLATAADGLVRIWRRSDGDVADTLAVDWKGCSRPSFDGKWIAPGLWHEMPYGFSSIGTGELRVISSSGNGSVGPAIQLPAKLVDSCICSDNRTVAAVSEDKGVGWLSLHDVPTGRAIVAPTRLRGIPRSVAARPFSSHVAVLCTGGELRVFDAGNGEPVLDLSQKGMSAEARVHRVEYTPDGATLLALVNQGNEPVLSILDAASGEPRCPPIRPILKDGPFRSFALSADSRMVATAVNGKNAAQVWDVATGRALSEPLPHPGDRYGLFCLCFSQDGRHLLTGGTDGQARLWDWKAGTLACPPMKHDDQVLSVAITTDGRFAVTAGRDRASKLHVWELSTGRLIAPKIPLPIHATAAIASSPSGSVVVASSSFVGSVSRVDLGSLLDTPKLRIEDYLLLGELSSGQRIEQGDESGLTQEEWVERLNVYRRNHPTVRR